MPIQPPLYSVTIAGENSAGEPTAVSVDDDGNIVLTADLDIDTTGLATSAKQDTGNASAASIDGKLTDDVDDNLLTSLGTRLAGEDIPNDVLKVEHRNQNTFITGTTAGQTLVTGAGLLHGLVIGKPAVNSVVTVYDNTAASGTILYQITFPAALLSSGPIALPCNVVFTTGLTVVVATAGCDLSVAYRDGV